MHTILLSLGLLWLTIPLLIFFYFFLLEFFQQKCLWQSNWIPNLGLENLTPLGDKANSCSRLAHSCFCVEAPTTSKKGLWLLYKLWAKESQLLLTPVRCKPICHSEKGYSHPLAFCIILPQVILHLWECLCEIQSELSLVHVTCLLFIHTGTWRSVWVIPAWPIHQHGTALN